MLRQLEIKLGLRLSGHELVRVDVPIKDEAATSVGPGLGIGLGDENLTSVNERKVPWMSQHG